MRALCYHNKDQNRVNIDTVLYNKAIDETGTVDSERISDSDMDSWGGEQGALKGTLAESEEISRVADEPLEVHRIAPKKHTHKGLLD